MRRFRTSPVRKPSTAAPRASVLAPVATLELARSVLRSRDDCRLEKRRVGMWIWVWLGGAVVFGFSLGMVFMSVLQIAAGQENEAETWAAARGRHTQAGGWHESVGRGAGPGPITHGSSVSH